MPSEDQPTSAQNDLKQKFAEALKAKRSQDTDPKKNRGKGPSQSANVHGQAGNKRVFRRKSG